MAPQTMEQILTGRRSQPNQLIEVLQDVQKNYGYLPEEALRAVSDGLGVPLIEVYRVASFYKAFRLKPAGKYELVMCAGTACHVRGAPSLYDQALNRLNVAPEEVTPDGKFSVKLVNCLGACALGPIVNENGTCHHHMTAAKLRKLIDRLDSQPVEEEQHA